MNLQALDSALTELPLVAILRGIQPTEIDAALDQLVAAGFRMIEVPLNSPQPFDSIARLIKRAPADVVVGAGTVLDTAAVARLADIGAALVVSPNVDAEVLAATQQHGLGALAGCYTPSEMFAALKGGAHALKLFPAAAAGTAYLKDIKAVLPSDTRVLAVGGIDLNSMPQWIAAGIHGFGIGGALYKPGMSSSELGVRAREWVQRFKDLRG